MPRPFFSVLSLPFWQDRKEGYPTQTITRMKGYVVLSKHEAGAGATKIYRLALVSDPPLDGGPAALPTARGFSRGNPLSRSLPSFCRHRKKGPAGEAVEEMTGKLQKRGGEEREPKGKSPKFKKRPAACLEGKAPQRERKTLPRLGVGRSRSGRRACHFKKTL